jgi:hypothetical protein
MKNQTIYGIKTTSINHHVIHTFKVKVTKTVFNEEIIKNSGLSYYFSCSKKGIEMIIMDYVTMDINDFNFKKAILVETLKKIALNKLEEKYKYMAY